MPVELVFLRYDAGRRAWEKARPPILFEGQGSNEPQAMAVGEAWRGEGSNERRKYTVVTDDKPFDGAR